MDKFRRAVLPEAENTILPSVSGTENASHESLPAVTYLKYFVSIHSPVIPVFPVEIPS